MTSINSSENPEPGTLARLRALIPNRALHFGESLRLAELQANRLLEHGGITSGPIPSDLVSELPRVVIEYRNLQTSGMSYWNRHAWVICLNACEPATRQRFTLFHELKHILDYGRTAQLYRGTAVTSAETQAEQTANYFAGCVLMPKRLLKREWGSRTQRPEYLAQLFEVSTRAIDVRLAQLGLSDPRPRCAPISVQHYRTPPRGTYFRQLSGDTSVHDTVGATL